MKRLQLINPNMALTLNQRFCKTESFQTFNSQQMELKRFNSATTGFQFLQTQNRRPNRSLSSKHNVFKSAKKIETIDKKRSNSFKNLLTQTSQNFSKKLTINQSKQFLAPTKSLKLSGGIINEKKSVQDILSRLRNKNSIGIEVKKELIINDKNNKKSKGQQLNEPQLNLKDMIKEEVSKRLQEQKQSNKADEQIIKMKTILTQKQNHFKKLQGQIGSKINWIQTRMSQFQERQTKIQLRQKSIIQKEKQIEGNLLKKIQEKHKNQQQQLQKQFYNKINQIKSQQNQQNSTHNQYLQNQIKKSQNSIQKTQINDKNIQNATKKIQQQKMSEPQIINFDSIQEITPVEKPKKQSVKVDVPQKIKKPQIQMKKVKQIEPKKTQYQTNNTSFKNQNKKTVIQHDEIEEIKQTPKQKPQQNTAISKTKIYQQTEILTSKIVNKQAKQSKSIQQENQVKKQKQKNEIKNQEKKLKKEQKIKIAEYLKVVNRVASLLYFMGEISHHYSTNMKKNKKYKFKVAMVYLFKYVYDKFRFIQKVYHGLKQKNAIPEDLYIKSFQQNKLMKQSYKKFKEYVYKKDPAVEKQSDHFLNENSQKLCLQDKNYFNEFLFKEIKLMVDFYYKDTKGEWSDHTVNLCYFRMLIAVFIIEEIEFNIILLETQQNQHPNYMIEDIETFTENELKIKMTEAYQLFNDLDFKKIPN